MTNLEFAEIIGYIGAACGKSLPVESQIVYFDLLGDLTADVFRLAAKRVALEHKWANFPTVAELREAAALTAQGEVSTLSPCKAWELAWDAIKRIDLDIDGSLQRATSKLPPIVLEAMEAMGTASLVGGKDKVPVVRAQFIDAFEHLAERDKRLALMPSSVRQAIEGIGEKKELAAPVRLALSGIGKDVA